MYQEKSSDKSDRINQNISIFKKDESEIIEFCSVSDKLFNNSEKLHTTISIKVHLHI